MTGQGPVEPTKREAEINAMLDNELDEASIAELKAAAADDGALAQAIIAAWQLQKSMDHLQLEKAPSSLSRKLKRIPREQKSAGRQKTSGPSRWVMAASMASVVLVAVAMMMSEPAAPPAIDSTQLASDAEIDRVRLQQTQRDLEVAFFYLDKVGLRLGEQIHGVLNEELSAPVKDNFSKYMPYSGSPKKEKQA